MFLYSQICLLLTQLIFLVGFGLSINISSWFWTITTIRDYVSWYSLRWAVILFSKKWLIELPISIFFVSLNLWNIQWVILYKALPMLRSLLKAKLEHALPWTGGKECQMRIPQFVQHWANGKKRSFAQICNRIIKIHVKILQVKILK